MKSRVVSLVAALVVASLAAAACSQAAPTPTQAPAKAPAAPTAAPAAPTKAPAALTAAPAAPAKAPEATKPAASPPTAAPAPAKKVDFPEKGKTITVIVPWAPGGPNDVFARLVASYLEKEMGTPVQIVNKPGASTQLGLTELVTSKPDGYTMLATSTLTSVLVYLDPERKAIFARKDFQPIAVGAVDPMGLGVVAGSPFKTVKDLVDAAKAAPDKVKVGDDGYLAPSHVGSMAVAKVAGAKFASVHFNSGAENLTALMGGHTDATMTGLSAYSPHVKSGAMRVLGITDSEESKFFPGAKPLPQQGYNLVMVMTRGFAAPAGVPAPIVEILTGAIKKVTQNEEFRKKAEEASVAVRYMDPVQFAAHWEDLDKQVKPMLDEARSGQTK